MKNELFKLLICLIILSSFYSCEKYFLSSDPKDDPVTNFDYLWSQIDEKYSYLHYKNINWDSIYTVYRPLISDEMDNKLLFEVLANMLYTLKDGHVNLTSSFNRSRNWSWYLDYPPNFNRNIVERNYLGDDYFITGPLHNTIIDSVLYVYYSSFSNTISDDHLDELISRAQGTKGVIIDIRHNGGGSLSNAYRLASRFTSSEVLFGYDRIKTGRGRNDFSDWNSMVIKPHEGAIFTGDVVVLCNRLSYSTASFFALMMKALPNAFLIGDDAGGGGGIPMPGELPNGWLYRFSVTQTVDADGNHIESGVPVDIRIDLDPVDESIGVDSIIEEALNRLSS